MSNTVIRVENLSKQYRLGEVGTGALKDDIKRWRYKMMGKEDPFLIIGEVNDRTTTTKLDYVWALKEINFDIKKGEVVGIIGKNGAGKSTLLKILSRTTGPTIGSVKMKGRIASLLEVGTGFHPELSGRENIYLNGAILGMRKNEIKRKFDEIVFFSGVERYIDTPVKRYSSGMYVRLAFGVAAHLESEILIVDEVLAVGDAEFQKKCLGRMKDVSTNEGRTVLFVSHNLQAISTICERGIVIEKGRIHIDGTMGAAVNDYFNLSRSFTFDRTTAKKDRLSRTNGKMIFTKAITINNDDSENKIWSFKYNQPVRFRIECIVNEPCDGLTFYMYIKSVMSEIVITNLKQTITARQLESREVISFIVTIPSNTIRPGQYDLYFAIGNTSAKIWYDVIDGNVNLPALIVSPSSDDPHENFGTVTIPFTIENIKYSSNNQSIEKDNIIIS
ncbi:MAG: ABC transporter ATP-binding protein [Chitinophagaceae bacterium]